MEKPAYLIVPLLWLLLSAAGSSLTIIFYHSSLFWSFYPLTIIATQFCLKWSWETIKVKRAPFAFPVELIKD